VTLSERQDLAITLLNHPQVVEIDFGGAAGGGKSLLVCLWMLMELRKYPGIRIGLGRKEGKRLRETTVLTLTREAHQIMGVLDSEYRFQDQAGLFTYSNGSQIQLVDLNYQPSDPDFDTFGSMLFTHVVIEEVGEIRKKARDVFSSRANRWMNDKYNIVGKTVFTQNPSQNFTRSEFYEPYKKMGMGSHRLWKIGRVEVSPGLMKDSYRAFVKSLPTDNPFIARNYIERLKNLPDQEKKRLLQGNWDYMDDSDGLFSSLMLDRATAHEMPEERSPKYIGVDVADKGKDKTVVSLIENGVATIQVELNVDTTGEKPISHLYGAELIKFAQQHGFNAYTAASVAIEGNGVGVGIRDYMRSKGWYITIYEATSVSRSLGFWRLSVALGGGDEKTTPLTIYSGFDQSDEGEVRKQLSVHTYEMDDQLRPKVLQKKYIKEELGYSPDQADSLMIANWIRTGGVADPKQDQSRISF
jgi:phage terminase large subunit